MKKLLNILTFLLLLSLLFSCNREKKDYYKAKQINSIEALKEFAVNHPNSEFIDSAKGIIDKLIWDTIVQKNSMKNYEMFILEHPGSMFIDSAKDIVDKMLWQEVKSLNTVSDYETFIEDYPESKFIDSAKIMIGK
jgi:outer membrane protein assembly factor BamD (BamD/ComL family)